MPKETETRGKSIRKDHQIGAKILDETLEKTCYVLNWKICDLDPTLEV